MPPLREKKEPPPGHPSYTKKEIDGGTVKVTDRGPRKEMLKKEREKVETNPGPKNKEPWAGKKKEQP